MKVQRQLAAIMFTDIVGYTALMGKDSGKAMELVDVSMDIQKPLVEKHQGKWLKEMGDGAMAQFASALDAVNCALEIQENARLKLDAQLRIGIHSGDITIRNNDIYGDGVNVAARLESITDPGGIYISESIEKAIRGQTNIQSKFLGEIQLKNVDYGVRTYALQGTGLPVPNMDKFASPGLARKTPWLILAAATLVAAIGVYVYFTYIPNNSKTSGMDQEIGVVGKSIAVLPFDNRSNLKDDEFFTDGVHDDLLTQISKIRDIKTISRTSVMEYRNTTKNMRTIGAELGVATILEGGVQRAGNQIRINVQLIDAKTDAHLWAETYTRELSAENIFAIQSEIAQTIAGALASVLSTEEKQNIEKFPTQNLAALEAYFHAKSSSSKNNNQGFREAMDHLTRAIELDTTFAIAYAELGRIMLQASWMEGLPLMEQIAKAKPLIGKAMRLDSTSSEVQRAFGILKGHQQDTKAQELAFQKALELNPNNAQANATYGRLLRELGNNTKGFELLFKAKELDPLDDQLAIGLANQLSNFGRYDEARKIAKEIIARNPNYANAYGTLAGIAYYYDHQLAECLRLNVKKAWLLPGYPFIAFFNGMNSFHIGEKERAIDWFNYGLSISPDFWGAILAQGYIYEFGGEYNKALDYFLKTKHNFPPEHFVFQEVMLRLLELGLATNRIPEVIDHYKEVMPDLFQSDVRIDKNNFIPAYALGSLLKAKGELEQAEHLLKGSLEISQVKMRKGPGSPENNWECRIYLAMGNHRAAIAAFVKLVAEGIHSFEIVDNPVYQPLYDDPDFKKSMEIMKERLKQERVKVKEMEANGELDIPQLPDKAVQNQ